MSKKLHLKIEMAAVNISMSYLVTAAITKKDSHVLSVMHVALFLFLEFIIVFHQILRLKCTVVWIFHCINLLFI